MSQKKTCKAITKAGKPCLVAARADGYCAFHSPARAEAQAEARKKGGEASPAKIITLDGEVKLTTVAKVDELIDKIIDEMMNTKSTTRGGAFNLKKGRTVGYLAGIKLRALEIADFEERISALEERLKTK